MIRRETHHAFGDESAAAKVVCYAMLSFPDYQQEYAENLLAACKIGARLDGDVHLHCRAAFHGDERARGPLAGLSFQQIFDLYHQIATQFAAIPFRRVVAYARRTDFPEDMLLGPMPETSDRAIDFGASYPPSDKALIAHCAQGVLLPFSKSPGLDNVRLWQDPETTKIKWAIGKMQAGRASSRLIDVGPSGGIVRPEIMHFRGTKPPLLEVADLIAYVTAKALSKGKTPNDRRIGAIFEELKPELIRLRLSQDGGLCFSVPDASMMTGQ